MVVICRDVSVVVCAECDLVWKLALNGRPSVMMRRVRAPRSQQESAERGAHNLLRIRFTECENTGEGNRENGVSGEVVTQVHHKTDDKEMDDNPLDMLTGDEWTYVNTPPRPQVLGFSKLREVRNRYKIPKMLSTK